MEGVAILQGLQQCMHMEISHILIESDCQYVVNQILNEEFSSKLGNLLYDIKDWMGKLVDCHIQFAYHEYNRVAHSLARHAWSIPNISLWYGVEPSFISPLCGLTIVGSDS